MRGRKLICLALCLLLLCGTAFADASFSFRDGVTWSTTPAQMLAAEGVDDSGVNKHDDNGYTYYYLKGQNVYYVYRGEQLVQAYRVESGGAYAAALERLTSRYGTPADVAADTVASLWNALVPGGLSTDQITGLSAWRLSDSTLATLFMIDGAACTAFFQEQRI